MSQRPSQRDGDTALRVGRRSFLTRLGRILAGVGLALPLSVRSWAKSGAGHGATATPPRKLIFIAIDSLHPAYLSLDRRGYGAGSAGDWLMPNVRRFLDCALWYPKAKCFLPAATDMNHLNVLAGTNTAQTGIFGVARHMTGWDNRGRPIVRPAHLSLARDAQGRPVDTLFHAWKRRWPQSTTAFVSGKGWVADMFRETGGRSPVDLIVTGSDHPVYLRPPLQESFADPPTDRDAGCDPESPGARLFSWKRLEFDPLVFKAFEGQGGLLTRIMEGNPDRYPHDRWIVDSALALFEREDPDLAYVLMAQADDAGHCLGAAWDPAEFVSANQPFVPDKKCKNLLEYQFVSQRNRLLYREAILDSLRDVDIQFGRLIDRLAAMGWLDRGIVILVSDHAMVNHLRVDGVEATDFMAILRREGLCEKRDALALTVSGYGCIYWRNRSDRVAAAKDALMAHRAINPVTGRSECPWWVLDRTDMIHGVPGVSLPGELESAKQSTGQAEGVCRPDLLLLSQNGWQLPVYRGQVPNVNYQVPGWLPPFHLFSGGHGSVDTLPITAAIALPGGKTGQSQREIRIADLGVTAAALVGLSLSNAAAGHDLREDLG